jgi:small subunit ribosomal protein S16
LAVKIRLARTGRKNISRYRIVAIDGPVARDGKFLEVLGNYNPQANPKQFTVNTERIAHWISLGAQVSETVANLLKQDRFGERVEGLKKGLALDTLNIERRADRKRKPKNSGKKNKGEEAAKPA